MMNKLQTALSWVALVSVLLFYISLQVEIANDYDLSLVLIFGLLALNSCLFYYLVYKFNEKRKANQNQSQKGRK